MASVSLHKLEKSYGALRIVKGIDLKIEDGEFVVLVGPSGCGKSTTLRMIAGLETITGGDVRIGDRIVNQLPPRERDIAMVFQDYALYPHKTVRENMGFSLKVRGVGPAEAAKRVGDAAEMLGISHLLDRRPGQLSGGQRQRVAMGRAIVREPAAFLFDEPLSNLDAKLRVQMRVEIKCLQRSLATTSVYVTHDQMEAMTLADRLVVLNGGRIEQVGTPIELYEKPATTFVATFIGSPSMNLLAADGNFGLSEDIAIAHDVATIGFRPEDLRVLEAGQTADFTAQARVEAVELVGAESFVHGALPNGQSVVFRVPGRTSLSFDDRVSIAADRQALHLFDQAGHRMVAAA